MPSEKEMLDEVKLNIIVDIGSLDDFPYEVANTIANVYYRYTKLPYEMSIGSISIEEFANIHSCKESISEFVRAIRNIDKKDQPQMYSYSVQLFLDIFKYNIQNAHKKSEMWRYFERKFKKSNVNEINTLITLLNI